MRKAAIWLTIVAMLPGAAAGRTPTPPDDHDVQCFFVLSAMSAQASGDASKEAAVSNASLLGGVYFGGKIYGADPNYDLVAAAKVEAPKLTKAKATALLKECGDEMQTFGNWLTESGTKMKAAGL